MSVKELKKSGLPLCIDESNHVMQLSALLKYQAFGRKNTESMLGLLRDETGVDLEQEFYDVYRRILFPEDEDTYTRDKFSYDITIVMPGQVNGECKKTSGHYHGWNSARTNTYGEVYEVIKGTAMYILQRADNFDTEPQNVKVEDLLIATVQEGQTIIVPPNYGHCSVNIGEGALVFSNLAYTPCPVCYDSVKYYHGMGVYILKENGKIRVEKNNHYKNVPEPKFVTVKENPQLGIKFGIPVYESYKKNPDAFRFLAEPDGYIDEIMGMLQYEKRGK